MPTPKCPGQDTQKWGPDAVYDVACKKCGKCLPKCPNDIRIIEQLAEVTSMMEELEQKA